MQITNNNLSIIENNLSYQNKITKNNSVITQNEKSLSDSLILNMPTHLNELSNDIKDTNFKLVSIELEQNEIIKLIKKLDNESFLQSDSFKEETKSVTVDVMPLVNINQIPDELIKNETQLASYFLNKDQKFFSESEAKEFVNRAKSLNINDSYLSDYDKEIYRTNHEKAEKIINGDTSVEAPGKFDFILRKVDDAKRVLNDVLNIKKSSSLFSSNSYGLGKIDNNKEVEKKLEILDEVKDKLMLASKDSTSIETKEKLYNEIKDLLKDMDDEVVQALFEGFEDYANPSESTNTEDRLQKQASYVVGENEYTQFKNGNFALDFSKELDKLLEDQKKELESISNPKIEFSSSKDAKEFLEKAQRNDVNIENLSAMQKTVYIQNKLNAVKVMEFGEKTNHYLREKESEDKESDLINSLKNNKNFLIDNEEYTKLNKEINTRFDNVLKIQEEEVSKIKNTTKNDIQTAQEAKDFLELSKRRKEAIENFSDIEKKAHEKLVNLAKEVIDNEEMNNHKEYESIYKAENLMGTDVKRNHLNELFNELENSKNRLHKSILSTISNSSKNSTTENNLNINYQKESTHFSKENIADRYSILAQTQAININQSHVSKLLS
jgi:hypothetical protein